MKWINRVIGDSESAHIVLFVRFLCLGEHGGKSHEAAAVALRANTKNFRGAGVSLRINQSAVELFCTILCTLFNLS